MSDLEQELGELGGDIASALEAVRMPAALVDLEGLVRWQNRASRERIGMHIGRPFTDFIGPDETEDAKDVLRRIVCSGEPADLTVQIRLADGSLEPRDLSAAPVQEGGSVVGVFGLSATGRPRRSDTPTENDLHLTDRQLEVLQLLADGRSTRQIATELSVSTTTVRNHIAHVMAALDAHTRLQAVVAASRAGLISLAEDD